MSSRASSRGGVGRGECNFSVDAPWAKQSRVQDIIISSHENLDILGGLKPIQLVRQLQRCMLHCLSPPEPPSCCEEQTESLLFMTMIDGVCSHAVTNSSLAILAPSLMKFCTIQSQMMNKGTTATPTVSSQCLRSMPRHSLGLRDAQGFKDA